MTEDVQHMHDVWVVLTVIAIAGWLVLLLRTRSVLMPLKEIWPEMYRFFQFAALAVFGTMFEMACADMAAYFYQPAGLLPGNLYLRLMGRAGEAMFVIVAVIASLVLDLRKKRG